MFETISLIDNLFTIAACISAGFLVYGGWLCLPVSSGLSLERQAAKGSPSANALV